jgi:hypothetical protein
VNSPETKWRAERTIYAWIGRRTSGPNRREWQNSSIPFE